MKPSNQLICVYIIIIHAIEIQGYKYLHQAKSNPRPLTQHSNTTEDIYISLFTLINCLHYNGGVDISHGRNYLLTVLKR